MSAIKERPILFGAPMVRALLDGRKTQTRRIVKRWHFCKGAEGLNLGFSDLVPSQVAPGFWRLSSRDGAGVWNERAGAICPYGKPGDLLWVRETWGFRGCTWNSWEPAVERVRVSYKANGTEIEHQLEEGRSAPLSRQEPSYDGDLAKFWSSWRASIHMPRWASRITLRITEVRVQRVQEISREDATAEGVCEDPQPCPYPAMHRDMFRNLWDSIHGPGAWQHNDWVWAISFEVVKR